MFAESSECGVCTVCECDDFVGRVFDEPDGYDGTAVFVDATPVSVGDGSGDTADEFELG